MTLKNNRFFLKVAGLMMALAAAGGCAPEEQPEEAPGVSKIEMTFQASAEQQVTKTVIQEDNSVFWSPGDAISIFSGSGTGGGSRFSTDITEPAALASFSGSLQTVTGGGEGSSPGSGYFWGIYPYDTANSCSGTSVTLNIPDSQTAKAGSFGVGLFPSVAHSGNLNLAFYNVCGGLCFTVSRRGILSMTFSSRGDVPIAGKVKVEFGSDDRPEVVEVLDPRTSVTLTAPDASGFEPGVPYYLVLMPGTLALGIQVSFETADHKTGSFSSSRSQTVKRSVFGKLQNIDSYVTSWTKIAPEPESVDLGLSVNWATFNLGAAAPEEYGDYFTWGDTEPNYEPGYARSEDAVWKVGKTGYDSSSYKWTGSSKYGSDSALEPEDDAARANWGDAWRMPTKDEFDELLNDCTWSAATVNGVDGYLVTSNKTGYTDKSIFLPKMGTRALGFVVSSWNYYLTSTSTGGKADVLNLSTTGPVMETYWKDSGFQIRPVEKTVRISGLAISREELTLYEGRSVTLSVTVTPATAEDKTLVWSSSNTSVASVDQNGVVSALQQGSSTITAETSDHRYKVTCELTVKPFTAQAVDLGLSVLWSSVNLGAVNPEDSGDYLAWGETDPYYKDGYAQSTEPVWKNGKEEGYRDKSYKFAVMGKYSYEYTKYVTKSSYGTVDNNTELDPEDDAAAVNWGGGWHMPTKAEWDELMNGCTWTKVTRNGMYGWRVTGKTAGYTDKSIFLPAAGYRSGTAYFFYEYNDAKYGFYWSASLREDYSDPYSIYFSCFSDSQGPFWSTDRRTQGNSVRPVKSR